MSHAVNRLKGRRVATWLAVPLALVSMSACSAGAVPANTRAAKPKPAIPPGGVLLEGAGATFPAVLYDEWFRMYHSMHPTAAITYDAVGSGEGVRRFVGRNVSADETVDFGASDAAMRDDEIAMVADGVQLLPLTAGSVALAYDVPGVSDLKLSRQAYTGIFLGQIKRWNDPVIARANPGAQLPNLTIATVVRQDGSGTTFAFTKHLDAISDSWRSQYGAATLVNWPGNSMRATGNEGVAARIKQSIGAIGYVSYEFALKAGLQTARLQNRAGTFVAPGDKSATAALAAAEVTDNLRFYVPDPPQTDAYPIVTLTWVLLYRHYADARKAAELHDLLHWCLTDGQQYAARLGYTPLPSNIQQRALTALEQLSIGRVQ